MKPTFFLLLAAVIAAGCEFDDFDYELEVTETQTWEADQVSRIVAETVNGNLSASVNPNGAVTADITRRCTGRDKSDAEKYIENVVVTGKLAGGQLELYADMPPGKGRSYGADLDLLAPAETHLTLSTANGNVTIVGMTGGAVLDTTNGNLTAHTHAGSVDGHVTNGNIDCDVVAFAQSDAAVLYTTNGNATLTLPSTISVSFSAATTNGTVRIEGFPQVAFTADTATHKAGTIGTGGPTVEIATTNGNAIILAR